MEQKPPKDETAFRAALADVLLMKAIEKANQLNVNEPLLKMPPSALGEYVKQQRLKAKGAKDQDDERPDPAR